MDGLVGESEVMRGVFERIRRFAAAKGNVMIAGEVGTGKGTAAQALHEAGGLGRRPFVRVHCPSLAVSGNDGGEGGPFPLAEAAGGTLFLDEVGDLPMPAQVQLLAVLEERASGGGRRSGPPCRVVSAASTDLAEKARGGLFREDLHYRLIGLTIPMPALRRRREDIPLLTNHFLESIAKQNAERLKRLSVAASEIFQNHPWPGNVRQLKNILAHAAALCPGDVMFPVHLPEGFAETARRRESAGAGGVTRMDMLEALEATRWRKTRAAEALGMSRSTFYRKSKELNVS